MLKQEVMLVISSRSFSPMPRCLFYNTAHNTSQPTLQKVLPQNWLLKIYYTIFLTGGLKGMVVKGADRQEERVFFTLKVLMCHVLFKLPSAGTPICTFPWGPIPLRLPSATQPASRSSITHSSIHPPPHPDPFIHGGQRKVHNWRGETGGQGGKKKGRKGKGGKIERREEKERVDGRLWKEE